MADATDRPAEETGSGPPAPDLRPGAGSPPTAGMLPDDLDRSLLSGLAWLGSVKWLGQALTWAITIVVARLLRPEDYGVVAMAGILLGLVELLTEFGIGTAVVVHRHLGRDVVGQLHAVALLLAGSAFLLCLAAAAPLAGFFDEPAVAPTVAVMSAGFLVSGLRVVPFAALERDLRFRSRALIEGAQTVAASATTLVLALLCPSHWALVFGGLAGHLVATGAALVASPTPVVRPRVAELRAPLQLSTHIVVSRLCWFGYSRADSLVAGKLLGSGALGAYSFAMRLASLPIDKITSLVAQVTRSVFSQVQDQPEALRRYLLRLSGGLAFVTFPAATGVAVVADDFVRVALGEKWEAAVAPLRLLALYASYRSVSPLLPHVLNVRGHSGFAMRMNILALLLLPPGFLLGSRWGLAGIAAAWLLLHPIATLPLYRRVFGELDLSPRAYLDALAPAVVGCVGIAAAVLALRATMAIEMPALRLVAEVATGVLAYGLVVAGLFRGRLAGYWQMLRTLRRGPA